MNRIVDEFSGVPDANMRWRLRNPERYREVVEKSRGKRAELNRKYNAARRATPEAARRENDRLILQRTGWTPERSLEFMVKQAGRCAICLRSIKFSGRKGLDRACRDHDHDTRKPRALLCLQCNTHLGGYESAKKTECVRLAAFDEYLEDWNV